MRITIALPVYNEERVLRSSVTRVASAAAEFFGGHDVEVIIADNDSEDSTGRVGRELEREFDAVSYLAVGGRGKGLAVRRAWESRTGDVNVFMDIDLATDLAALPRLVSEAAECGGLAIGSRFHPESVVTRSLGRRLVSRCYRTVLKLLLRVGFSDAPCGFKAVSARVVREIMPQVEDNRWFFDTEMLVRAERAGFEIREVPVTWREDGPDGRPSKVNVPKIAREYLKQVLRLRRQLKR